MPSLGSNDVLHLKSAIGWVELGNAQAAWEELHRIPAPLRQHPDVLEVHCRIFGLAKHWRGVSRLGKLLQDQEPDRAAGWLFHAEGLHHSGEAQAARALLLEAWEKVSENQAIAYHLARYYCASGNLAEAAHWLDKALKAGDERALRWRALEDPFLQPLQQART